MRLQACAGTMSDGFSLKVIKKLHYKNQMLATAQSHVGLSKKESALSYTSIGNSPNLGSVGNL